jgi:hypothetical protein
MLITMPDHAQEHPVVVSSAERISELNSIDKVNFQH